MSTIKNDYNIDTRCCTPKKRPEPECGCEKKCYKLIQVCTCCFPEKCKWPKPGCGCEDPCKLGKDKEDKERCECGEGGDARQEERCGDDKHKDKCVCVPLYMICD